MTHSLLGISLEDYHLQHLPFYLTSAMAISLVHYHGICGFLYWYYYVHKRDKAQEWKIQSKFEAWESVRRSIWLGTFNSIINALFWGTLVCYTLNGGMSNVYFSDSDYGWTWFILQFPLVFICQDYFLYWYHRLFHIPFLYKWSHKVHHQFKQPTAYAGLATHPVEFLGALVISGSQFFLFPVHWVTLVTVLSYYALNTPIEHSGVDFKGQWWQPWQPDTKFHDDHHKYTHVNFGNHLEWWDQMHGTCRKRKLDEKSQDE